MNRTRKIASLNGGVAEWSKAPHSKCGKGEIPSWVRIPPPPQSKKDGHRGRLFCCTLRFKDRLENFSPRGSVFGGNFLFFAGFYPKFPFFSLSAGKNFGKIRFEKKYFTQFVRRRANFFPGARSTKVIHTFFKKFPYRSYILREKERLVIYFSSNSTAAWSTVRTVSQHHSPLT